MAVIAFYLIAAVVLVSALSVIMARNPVHSVLWLILAFFSSAGLLVLIGAEFLAMLLVVVYVGAVAVLFLFVVMMLDVDFVELKRGTLRYWPFAVLVGIIFAAEIVLASVIGTADMETNFDAIPAAVPDGGHHPARCHGWCHRADAAPPSRDQASEHCQTDLAPSQRCL